MHGTSKLLTTVLLVCCLLWSGWTVWPSYPPNTLQAWVLDVGQGESILVREPSGKFLLFDGGPDDTVLSQLGAVLPPWHHHLDIVVLSHNHSDHLFGLIAVLQRFSVGEFWLSGAITHAADFQELYQLITTHPKAVKPVFFDSRSCQTVCPPITPFGQASIQVYHPLEDFSGKEPRNPHDATVSIKVTYSQQSLLLTGDLEEVHEKAILAACMAPACSLKSSILQVPHHGSGSGLLPDFLNTIHPIYAVIPVGINNSFHHPAPNTLHTLEQAHVPFFRTDLEGRLTILLPNHGRATIRGP